MKNTPKILLLFILLVSIISCSKKDGTSVNNNSVTGKWYFVTDSVTVTGDGISSSQLNTGVTTSDYEQFNANGTGNSLAQGITSTFTYSVSGNKLTVNTPASSFENEQIPASTKTATIQSVNSTDLHIYYSNIETDDGITVTVVESIHFNRH